jgi:hypothetical protein
MTERSPIQDPSHDSRQTPSATDDENLNDHSKPISRAAAIGATLLPRSIASVVSFFAQSTSLSLRVGTYFGGAAIGGARVTTLTGLELSRALVEAVLTRAGRDVATRSNGELGRLEAESVLERSVNKPRDNHICINRLADLFHSLVVGGFALDSDLGFLLCGCGVPSV